MPSLSLARTLVFAMGLFSLSLAATTADCYFHLFASVK
jgi:hypothetical protein